MTLDPKIAIWLNIIYAVCTGATATMLSSMGIANATQVVAIMSAVGMVVNIVLHAYSSDISGPMVSK